MIDSNLLYQTTSKLFIAHIILCYVIDNCFGHLSNDMALIELLSNLAWIEMVCIYLEVL